MYLYKLVHGCAQYITLVHLHMSEANRYWNIDNKRFDVHTLVGSLCILIIVYIFLFTPCYPENPAWFR